MLLIHKIKDLDRVVKLTIIKYIYLMILEISLMYKDLPLIRYWDSHLISLHVWNNHP